VSQADGVVVHSQRILLGFKFGSFCMSCGNNLADVDGNQIARRLGSFHQIEIQGGDSGVKIGANGQVEPLHRIRNRRA